MRRTGARLVAAVAVAAFAVSGCGSESGEAADSTPTSPAVGSPQESGGGDGNQAGKQADGTTAPGTELKIGEPATIRFESYEGEAGKLELTVTGIEPGDQAALEAKFGEDTAGIVPYYIRFTAKNLGDATLGRRDKPKLKGLTADGSWTGVTLMGDLDGCVERSFSKGGNTGDSIESCILVGSRDDEVTTAAYMAGYGGYSNAEPLTWRK